MVDLGSRREISLWDCRGQKKRTSEEVLSEVWIGVEPTNDGFADQSLTAWVPHRKKCMFNI